MPINPKLVHVYQLSDAVEGREKGAWVFQYHGESFVTDPGGANAEPFAWADQPHQVIDFEVKTREEIAGAMRINPAMLGVVQRTDASFPAPIATFHDGPIWSAEAVEPWAGSTAAATAVPARDGHLPRG
jgi:hypothetical protein